MDDPSPTAQPTKPIEFGRESGPASAGSGDQPNWLPLHQGGDQQGQDVQRTLESLALGGIAQPPFRSSDINSTSYGNSESSNTGAETGLSPDTMHSNSNRPTPNSSTPSESRSNLQPGQSNSQGGSYAASPTASNQARVPPHDGRTLSSFFSTQPDYSSIPAGLTPDNTFSMPETPGRSFDVPSGWEMNNQSTGLTPVGEGVFRTLMGLGPMDPMDLGWEGGS